MSILDLTSKNIIYVEKNAPLVKVSRLMKEHHVGAVIVLNSDGGFRPAGIITDRDVALSLAEPAPAGGWTVENLMSHHVVTIGASAPIHQAIELMELRNVRRVVVVDDDSNVTGLVSLDDILRHIAREVDGISRLTERQLLVETHLSRKDAAQEIRAV